MNIHIQLTVAGASVGDFNLYSNVDNFTLPFATHVTRDILLAGQVFAAPDGTNQIRIESNTLCTNSIFVVVGNLPDPTTSTTSTTTTSAEGPGPCFPLSLGFDSTSPQMACEDPAYGEYHGNGATLSTSSRIYYSNDCNGGLAGSGYYSDGQVYRYWNGVDGMLSPTPCGYYEPTATCFNWRLTADPLEDSTFDITYCDDSTETLTVPANHSDFVCAKDVANPSGGAAFTEKLDPCVL